MSPVRSRFGRLLVVLVSFVVTLGACVSSDGGDTTTTRSLAVAQTTTTATTTTISTTTTTSTTVPARLELPPGTEFFTVASAFHFVDAIDYEQEPPVGGDHADFLLNCGVYDAPVPNENAVHSLEHRAIWITYKPGLDHDQVATLRLAAFNKKIIVSPYPGLEVPVVVSAWGYQLRLDSAEDPRLDDFISTYEGFYAPGGPCSGGVGSPSG